ncbi:unnamed protein product, partial [Heterotrigona itama]
ECFKALNICILYMSVALKLVKASSLKLKIEFKQTGHNLLP